MSTETLTKDSPFVSRLRAYLAERFPLFSHINMVIIYFVANQFLAQVLGKPGEKLIVSWFTLIGTGFLFCTFFHLRVFDEHKDYKEDCKHYPDRILSRNLITLKHLKVLGAVAIFIEIICASISSIYAVIAVGITIFYSWIMLKEFFVAEWLKRHFILYAISHMTIMPLMTATIFSFTMQRPFWEAPWLFWAYAAADFFAFSNWEVSRKIKLPEDELDGVSSYSKTFGMFKANYLVVSLRILNTVLAWIVGVYLNLGFFYYLGLIVLFIITFWGSIRFHRQPTRKHAKALEGYGGAYIILFYFILAIELYRINGLTFGA